MFDKWMTPTPHTRPLWNFSEKLSILVSMGVPKQGSQFGHDYWLGGPWLRPSLQSHWIHFTAQTGGHCMVKLLSGYNKCLSFWIRAGPPMTKACILIGSHILHLHLNTTMCSGGSFVKFAQKGWLDQTVYRLMELSRQASQSSFTVVVS